MLEAILQGYGEEAQARLGQLREDIRETLDFVKYERGLTELMNELAAREVEKVLNELIGEQELLVRLKQLGSKLALRFKEYRR